MSALAAATATAAALASTVGGPPRARDVLADRPLPGDALLAEMRALARADQHGAQVNLRALAQSFAWQVDAIAKRHAALHGEMRVFANMRTERRRRKLEQRRAARGRK